MLAALNRGTRRRSNATSSRTAKTCAACEKERADKSTPWSRAGLTERAVFSPIRCEVIVVDVPPELGPTLIDAMSAWVKGFQATGKIEAVWGYAGTGGGGGILNVDSHEELDAVMSSYPFGAFSDVEIIPIVDLDKALANTKNALQAMAG